MSVILNPAGVGQTDSPRTFALPLGCHANVRVSQSRLQRGRKQSLQSHLIEIFIRTPAPMAEPAPAAAAALTGDTGGRKKSTGQEPAANKKKKNTQPFAAMNFYVYFSPEDNFLMCSAAFVKGGAGRARFCKKNKSSERP